MPVRRGRRAAGSTVVAAVARGLSASAIGRLLAGSLWTVVAPGVYLSAAHRWTTRARVRAGALWLGDTATPVGVGAAWWWRLQDEPRRAYAVVDAAAELGL